MDRLARSLAELDRLLALDGRLAVLSFRPVRRVERRVPVLPAGLVERAIRLTEVRR